MIKRLFFPLVLRCLKSHYCASVTITMPLAPSAAPSSLESFLAQLHPKLAQWAPLLFSYGVEEPSDLAYLRESDLTLLGGSLGIPVIQFRKLMDYAARGGQSDAPALDQKKTSETRSAAAEIHSWAGRLAFWDEMQTEEGPREAYAGLRAVVDAIEHAHPERFQAFEDQSLRFFQGTNAWCLSV